MRAVLIIGPESSGTRFLTEILAAHPQVLGSEDASQHEDVLDDVWFWIQKGKAKKALSCFPAGDQEVVLTRRSMPHALRPNKAARYRDFVDLDLFNRVVRERCSDLTILVTARNPVANLASWTLSRHSAGKDIDRAITQYQECYAEIFRFVGQTGTPFLVVPMESVLLDPCAQYVNCLFRALGLPEEADCTITPRLSVNRKHFDWFLDNGRRV